MRKPKRKDPYFTEYDLQHYHQRNIFETLQEIRGGGSVNTHISIFRTAKNTDAQIVER